jgi:hypothetical protein
MSKRVSKCLEYSNPKALAKNNVLPEKQRFTRKTTFDLEKQRFTQKTNIFRKTI